MLNSSKIRKDFPILKRKINGKPIVYLDSTASSLKPSCVIRAVLDYYSKYSVNIFRGVYKLSQEATVAYEQARAKVASFIGTPDQREIIFTSGTTESFNLLSYSLEKDINSSNEIILSVMEHHANIVPWQQLAYRKGAKIKYIDIDTEGKLKIEQLENLVSKKTKILSLAFISNVLGTINPIKKMITIAKKINPKILTVIDAAQATPHLKVEVKNIGCDFLAFSGHKMLGPTGIGVLYGKLELLEKMTPFQTGGEMIREVTLTESFFKDPPYKFEAGTPHIAGAIGLAAAVDYLKSIDLDKIRLHEKELTSYALEKLTNIKNLTIYGPANYQEKGGVIAFNIAKVHPHDVAEILNRENICIRSGHHCAMPLHQRLGVSGSCRASFYIYNTREEIDELIEGLYKVKKIFRI